MSLNALRKGSQTKTPAAKKSSVPDVQVDATLAKSIKEWKEAHALEQAAASRKAAAHGILSEAGSKLRVDLSRKDAKLYASVRLNGDGQSVKFTQTGRWIDMPADENEDTLRAEFTDKFDRYFKIEEQFTLKADDLTPELAQRIAEALGPDHMHILQRKAVIKPTEVFNQDCVLDSKISAQWDRIRQAHNLLVPFKASVAE